MTVLVVEDDPDCRELMCSVLRSAGYVVREAADGAQALLMLLPENSPEPAVIVLDLWLPVMTGPELIKVLKSYHRLSRIPIILTSGGPRYLTDVDGDAAWLPKPPDPRRMLELVAERCQARTERAG